LKIYGLIEPITGRSFFDEFSHLDSTVMGIFLDKFQQENQNEIHIVQSSLIPPL
jgi:hypothetical protein